MKEKLNTACGANSEKVLWFRPGRPLFRLYFGKARFNEQQEQGRI